MVVNPEMASAVQPNMVGIGSRVQAKWKGGPLYPGVIQACNGTSYRILHDDGMSDF